MSLLSGFAGGGVKSIQSGDVRQQLTLVGTGNEQVYVNVTISSVDTAKSEVSVTGWAYDDDSYTISPQFTGADELSQPMARLTSSTNLRIYSPSTANAIWLAARWQVVEYR